MTTPMIPFWRSDGSSSPAARACRALSRVLLPGVLGVTEIAEAAPAAARPSDVQLANYFRLETERLERSCLAEVRTLDDWRARRDRYRGELQEMLGLSPLPERTELRATVTGRLDAEGFTVEKLHYQSLPNLYVTANLYVPEGLTKPAPAILYVCGHGRVATNGVSLGNKTAYQHHGAWFARNGFVCLVLDTIQLGEIEGIHHGTYREGMWWWNARGYTPAGVETWNCIRALDYLEGRPEVDRMRLGVTGRSGGGAYSWWVAALDQRIRVAAPVAGITDLRNHVVDGTVEGHCDCMFLVNTYRWDYAQVAALVAPRPLLLANTDKDPIFPLDGVLRVHERLRRIYALEGASTNLGLLITEGGHKDTQDLQVPVFRWFNRHLKGEDPVIAMAAEPLFAPKELKVFDTLPADERTSRIHETFVPVATSLPPPASLAEWERLRGGWLSAMERHVFAGWPQAEDALGLRRATAVDRGKLRLEVWDFESQPEVPLRLYLLRRTGLRRPRSVVLWALDEAAWGSWLATMAPTFGDVLGAGSTPGGPQKGGDGGFEQLRGQLLGRSEVIAFLAPRGVGPTAWSGDAKKQVQIRRRFMLLGQTLAGMQVWDLRRGLEALRRIPGLDRASLTVEANGTMAVNALHASLFVRGLTQLSLSGMPRSHRDGPDYLNVLRFLDLDQVVAMAAERSRVRLGCSDPSAWTYAEVVRERLAWPANRLELVRERSPNSGSASR